MFEKLIPLLETQVNHRGSKYSEVAMPQRYQFDEIRPVIEIMADLVCCHGVATEEDGLIRGILLGRGFDLELIKAAEDWCDSAQSTGSIMDVLATFAPIGQGTRVSNPLERVAVSDDVWKVIEDCRTRGLITLDMAERMLEGARAMDTRDWDDEDVLNFLADACKANHSASSRPIIEQALFGSLRNYLS